MTTNPDILAELAAPGPERPALVVGFAAETERLVENARAKLARKGCDLILANDVSPSTGTFGGATNRVVLLGRDGREEAWPELSKEALASRLAAFLADRLEEA
jgi:phosphopantothenoylcysteine decarboxylase/phosphopantothenate--cysteine ligase